MVRAACIVKAMPEEAILPCTGKLAFDTRNQASVSANVVQYQHGTAVYPYKCQHCALWHLSSRTNSLDHEQQ